MKKNSPNSYLTTVNVDGHEVEVLIIDQAHTSIKEECWCKTEVQMIDGTDCLAYYQATSMTEYQALCTKAKAAASKKWAEFVKS